MLEIINLCDAMAILKEGYKDGYGEKLNDERNKGLNEGIEFVAMNMLRDNMDISMIQECTGLSLSRIQELSKELEIESPR